MPSCLTCFSCSRCSFPLCTAEDIIGKKVPCGTTGDAFQYQFEDLLNEGHDVPCYSRQEVTCSEVLVSSRVLELPLSTTGKIHALKALVQSESAQGQSKEALEQIMEELSRECDEDDLSPLPNDNDMPNYTSMGRSTETRIDIVAVSDSILGCGVVTSSRHAEEEVSNATNIDSSCLDSLPFPAKVTQWEAPGNFTVNESLINVKRSTRSYVKPWFKNFSAVSMVECPECHFEMGFLFERNNHENDESISDVDNPTGTASNKGSLFPDIFLGLELKNLKQAQWSLKDFQVRYKQAEHLESFRNLFPGVEDLQSLYSRLTALRTQGLLYHNLLGKHKEQHEFQATILQTQKSRMEAREGKMKTMQEIISSQRSQLLTQVDRLLSQSDYIKNQFQKLQLLTERFQIERMISTEKDQTINILREEVALLRDLNSSKLLYKKRTDIEDCSDGSEDTSSFKETDLVDSSDINSELQTGDFSVPPAHLCGIQGTPSYREP